MTENEFKIPNIQFCLQKLKELVESIPGDENETVDWRELAERKKVAGRVLDFLDALFSGPSLKVGFCSEEKVRIPPDPS